MKEPKPTNYDWVTARAKCSAAEMFDTLQRLAEANVRSRNEFHQSGQPNDRFKFRERGQEAGYPAFSIWDTWGPSNVRKAVDFRLYGDVIHIGSLDDGIKASLTLADSGDCKFKVGNEELDAWQLLRRALESLFFPAE